VSRVSGAKPHCLRSRASVEKFSGGGTKKKTKNSTIKLLLGGEGATEKYLKIAKKQQKIALLSFYLLYLYHV